MNGNTLRKIKSHLTKGVKIRNEQIKKYNEYIKEELSLKEIGLDGIVLSVKPNPRYFHKNGDIDMVKVKKRFPLINPSTMEYDY